MGLKGPQVLIAIGDMLGKGGNKILWFELERFPFFASVDNMPVMGVIRELF